MANIYNKEPFGGVFLEEDELYRSGEPTAAEIGEILAAEKADRDLLAAAKAAANERKRGSRAGASAGQASKRAKKN